MQLSTHPSSVLCLGTIFIILSLRTIIGRIVLEEKEDLFQVQVAIYNLNESIRAGRIAGCRLLNPAAQSSSSQS